MRQIIFLVNEFLKSNVPNNVLMIAFPSIARYLGQYNVCYSKGPTFETFNLRNGERSEW